MVKRGRRTIRRPFPVVARTVRVRLLPTAPAEWDPRATSGARGVHFAHASIPAIVPETKYAEADSTRGTGRRCGHHQPSAAAPRRAAIATEPAAAHALEEAIATTAAALAASAHGTSQRINL